jgi:hypothetical protein
LFHKKMISIFLVQKMANGNKLIFKQIRLRGMPKCWI